LSLVIHALVIGVLVWRANALLEGRGSDAGARAGRREQINFFALPASPPMTVDLPPSPRVVLSEIPSIDPIQIDLSGLEVTAPNRPVTLSAAGGPGGAASGAGSTGGTTGSGTGGEEGYIFPPDLRGMIVPPLEGRPRAVRGRPHRVTWWVAADGRIERVAVNPEIEDEKYRREFYARMLSYKFEPARTRDGRRVPGVVTITVTP
jgi:hypothetical protein